MKPYGVPRTDDVAHPDVADIHHYGLKSSVGKLPGRGGDIRSSFRNRNAKAQARRLWARKARAEAKAACRAAD